MDSIPVIATTLFETLPVATVIPASESAGNVEMSGVYEEGIVIMAWVVEKSSSLTWSRELRLSDAKKSVSSWVNLRVDYPHMDMKLKA